MTFTYFFLYGIDIETDVLREAFYATCKDSGSESSIDKWSSIIGSINDDESLHKLWKSYQTKYPYAVDIEFEDIIKDIWTLLKKINLLS